MVSSLSQAWPAAMPSGAPAARPSVAIRGGEARRRAQGAAGDGLEGEHDQRVSGEDGQRFAERDVDGGLAAPGVGIVEAREIVVHQRGAVQEFDAGGGGVGERRAVFAAGGGDGVGEA